MGSVIEMPCVYANRWIGKIVGDVEIITGLIQSKALAFLKQAQFCDNLGHLRLVCNKHGVTDEMRINEFVNYWVYADEDDRS